MARGDWLEPVFEFTFELTARVFFSNTLWEELTFS